MTALYELVTRDSAADHGSVDPLKYQSQLSDDGTFDAPSYSDELLTVKIRYKEPEGYRSQLMSFPVVDHGDMTLSEDSRFAAAVAGFGMILRDAGAQRRCTFDMVRQLALSARGQDSSGHRAEFLRLVEMVESMN